MTSSCARLKEALKLYLQPASLRMLFLGFSAGLPLLLVIGTLAFWLREASIDLKTIGFFSWVGLVYGLKWIWAPLVDRLSIPVLTKKLGQRRAWLLVAQVGLVISLSCLAYTNPAQNLQAFIVCALSAAFCSATQDIALDAYRIESAELKEQGALAAMYQVGYRLGMIWSGAGALAIAAWAGDYQTGYQFHAWTISYLIMAASVIVGMISVLSSPEGQPVAQVSSTLPWLERAKHNVIDPFVDLFTRFGSIAMLLLAIVVTYRISDVVMGVMANPFYSDMGFTKIEVSAVSKVFGVIMTLVGALLGGVVVYRLGVMRTMIIGAVLSALTNVLFSVLASMGHNLTMLVFTVSADNFASGLASAAFVAFLSGMTNKNFSATQYAILSSLMLILPKFLAGFSGVLVESIGYSNFFIFTACLGIPVFLLLLVAQRKPVFENLSQ